MSAVCKTHTTSAKGGLSMKRRQSVGGRVSVITMLAAVIMWSVMSFPALADMRIRTADIFMDEKSYTDIMAKQSRIRVQYSDDSGQIFDCSTGLVTIISPPEDGVYWQGTPAELSETLRSFFGTALGELSSFESLFGNVDDGGTGDVNVRVTTVGSDNIAGYDATHYFVEYDEGDGWQTYENLWLSPKLMQEVRSEVGACIQDVFELHQEMESFLDFLGLGALVAVASHPQYVDLVQDAYVMRTVQPFVFFGFEFETESIVVEVSNEDLSADLFSIPAEYTPVESPAELFGL